MRSRFIFYALLCAVLLLLAACSQGGKTPTRPESLFTEANAWSGPVPGDAALVGPDEFRRLIKAGELVLRSSEDVTAQRADDDARYDSNQVLLGAVSDSTPYLRELLAAAASGQDRGDVILSRPDGEEVVLEGLATQLGNAVYVQELAEDAENALGAYTLTFGLLSSELQARLPSPESLKGSPLAEVRRAAADLEELLAGSARLSAVRLDPTSAAPGFPAAPYADISTQGAGPGTDSSASCTAPHGFAATYWFPLKEFVSPVRSQARRGVCWAFAALGAIESRERVQNGTEPNLSEQFFINKVLNDWKGRDYREGFNAVEAINLASDARQRIPAESAWTYNPAPNRASIDDGKAEHFAGTCNPYGTPGGGWCSETAHQSPRVCTTVVFTYCGYTTMTFGSGGVETGRARQVWKGGDPLPLNSLVTLLEGGHVLLASFPVYEGIWKVASGADEDAGIVSNYDRKHFDRNGNYVDGSYGNHAVQIVGFLSNADLSSPIRDYNIGGGGYFIAKNSWGCTYGDGGYFYVPADYVADTFNSLAIIEMDSRRSEAWRREQANPGSSEAPRVTARNGSADLRVPINLRDFFSVNHPAAASVRLTLTSDVDGALYDGNLSLDPYLFPVPIERTFGKVGQHNITVRATYAGQVTERRFTLNVRNTPPRVALSGSGEPHRDEPYQLLAAVSDINEEGSAQLCANTTWSVNAPDTVMPATGCQVTVTFRAEGERTVSATTRDTDGATTTKALTLTVLPPSVNPYPRVTEVGVRERRNYLSPGAPCVLRSVAAGATIDFTAVGCNLAGESGSRLRYSAFVTVENPVGEPLTYDWRVSIPQPGGTDYVLNERLGTTSPEFVPYSPGNTNLVTSPCTITVTVHAPEAARSKSLTVWTGSCTYYATRLG